MTHVAGHRSQHNIGLMFAMVGAILFSAKAIVAKFLYRYGIDAVQLIALRMVFAAPVFMVMAVGQMWHRPALWARDRWLVILLGCLGYYLSSMLDFLGLQFISAGLERLILFLTPSFVLLIGAYQFKRRIATRQWISLAVAYAGIVLVFVHDLQFTGSDVWLGGVLVLGAALSYAIYLLGSGAILARVGTLRLVSYAMCVSTFMCLAQFALLRPFSELVLPLPVYGLSLINGLLCTVAPVLLTMLAVSRIGAGLTSQAGMLGPISTLLLGTWLLQEPISAWQVAGCALVLWGIYLLRKA